MVCVSTHRHFSKRNPLTSALNIPACPSVHSAATPPMGAAAGGSQAPGSWTPSTGRGSSGAKGDQSHDCKMRVSILKRKTYKWPMKEVNRLRYLGGGAWVGAPGLHVCG